MFSVSTHAVLVNNNCDSYNIENDDNNYMFISEIPIFRSENKRDKKKSMHHSCMIVCKK